MNIVFATGYGSNYSFFLSSSGGYMIGTSAETTLNDCNMLKLKFRSLETLRYFAIRSPLA